MFSSTAEFPDILLLATYETGKCYMEDNDCVMGEQCREKAFELMLAHLLYIQELVSKGDNAVTVTSASQGRVSVSLAQPPTGDSWDYWINLSPFGQALKAMLSAQTVGGFYIGGSNERRGFRKIGGGY
ncbi:DUF4054 domain-containing protein [Vibrio crassostreae]|uniref:DUF4054 domain-containing protein n=1 Tax=Vibrio crassostreae TaxID=246167 RepID=UPI001404AA96|nr:DUF4054 domain-containing protein [Vibrio crassostreae]